MNNKKIEMRIKKQMRITSVRKFCINFPDAFFFSIVDIKFVD